MPKERLENPPADPATPADPAVTGGRTKMESIRLYITAGQKLRYEREAAEAGLTFSEYMRRVIDRYSGYETRFVVLEERVAVMEEELAKLRSKP